MADIIEDPDFNGFDGNFVDNSFIGPKPEYNYTLLGRYMRKSNKEFKELSAEEIEQFRI